jgi:hypothetical protein
LQAGVEEIEKFAVNGVNWWVVSLSRKRWRVKEKSVLIMLLPFS